MKRLKLDWTHIIVACIALVPALLTTLTADRNAGQRNAAQGEVAYLRQQNDWLTRELASERLDRRGSPRRAERPTAHTEPTPPPPPSLDTIAALATIAAEVAQAVPDTVQPAATPLQRLTGTRPTKRLHIRE